MGKKKLKPATPEEIDAAIGRRLTQEERRDLEIVAGDSGQAAEDRNEAGRILGADEVEEVEA